MSAPRPARAADLSGAGLTLVAAIGFGTVSVTSRLAAEAGLGTLGYTTWRAITSVLLLLVFVLVATRMGRLRIPAPGDLPARERRALVAAAVVNLLLNAAVLLAIARLGVSLGMILFYTWPAMVAVAANRFQGEPIDRIRAAALVLSSIGLAVVILAPLLSGAAMTLDPVGVLLALGAAVGQVVYTLIAARGFPSVPSLAASTTLVAIAVPGNILLALFLGVGAQVVVPLTDPSTLPWAVVGGIVGSAIPGVALVAGIRRLGATRSSILMMIEPVVGVGLAWLLLGERPGPLQLVGGAMVVVAGILLQLPGGGAPVRRRRAHPGSSG